MKKMGKKQEKKTKGMSGTKIVLYKPTTDIEANIASYKNVICF